MTVKKLKKSLEKFGNDEEVFVAIFFPPECGKWLDKLPGTASLDEIESVTRNGGAQINIPFCF